MATIETLFKLEPTINYETETIPSFTKIFTMKIALDVVTLALSNEPRSFFVLNFLLVLPYFHLRLRVVVLLILYILVPLQVLVLLKLLVLVQFLVLVPVLVLLQVLLVLSLCPIVIWCGSVVVRVAELSISPTSGRRCGVETTQQSAAASGRMWDGWLLVCR